MSSIGCAYVQRHDPTRFKRIILLYDATVKYIPRNLDFTNCSGTIAFRNQDLS